MSWLWEGAAYTSQLTETGPPTSLAQLNPHLPQLVRCLQMLSSLPLPFQHLTPALSSNACFARRTFYSSAERPQFTFSLHVISTFS